MRIRVCLFTLAVVMTCCNILQAQSNLFESFENSTFPPVGWTDANGDFSRANNQNCEGDWSARCNVWLFNSDGPLGLEVIADPGQTSGNSACGENAQNSIPLSNLAIGTYYFRVYSYSQSPMVFTISAFGSALPVELSQFTGQVKEQENTLNWETQTEKNVAWHVVERSAEGTNLPSPVHHSTPTPTRPPRPGIGRKANI